MSRRSCPIRSSSPAGERASLGRRPTWAGPSSAPRSRDGGASFALTAPADQLFTATEANEWALCATVFERDPVRWANLGTELAGRALEDPGQTLTPPVLDERAALARLEELSRAEARPRLPLLLAAADDHALMRIMDDERVTLGAGCGAADFGCCVETLPWQSMHNIPTTLVTGSNGKTTSVRLIAACLAAQGLRCGYCSTDGVFVGNDSLAAGDYSGPAGARMVLREPTLQAAVLRLLAVASCAVVSRPRGPMRRW